MLYTLIDWGKREKFKKPRAENVGLMGRDRNVLPCNWLPIQRVVARVLVVQGIWNSLHEACDFIPILISCGCVLIHLAQPNRCPLWQLRIFADRKKTIFLYLSHPWDPRIKICYLGDNCIVVLVLYIKLGISKT